MSCVLHMLNQELCKSHMGYGEWLVRAIWTNSKAAYDIFGMGIFWMIREKRGMHNLLPWLKQVSTKTRNTSNLYSLICNHPPLLQCC